MMARESFHRDEREALPSLITLLTRFFDNGRPWTPGLGCLGTGDGFLGGETGTGVEGDPPGTRGLVTKGGTGVLLDPKEGFRHDEERRNKETMVWSGGRPYDPDTSLGSRRAVCGVTVSLGRNLSLTDSRVRQRWCTYTSGSVTDGVSL